MDIGYAYFLLKIITGYFQIAISAGFELDWEDNKSRMSSALSPAYMISPSYYL